MIFSARQVKISLIFLLIGLVTAVFTHRTLQAKETGGTVCQVPTPEKTIQQALWDVDCDIVHIADGTHVLEFNLLINRTVELRGSSTTNVILDGNANDSVIVIYGGATNVVIHDMTIRNGKDKSGGGIYNEDGEIFVHDVRLINNEAASYGAGFFNGGQAILEQVELSHNTVPFFFGGGGGLHNNAGGSLTLTNVTISTNEAGNGGGISNSGTITMTNVTVANNTVTNDFAYSISNAGTIYLKNTLVTNPQFFNCNGIGTFISLGNNLENGDSCYFNQADDQVNVDAQLSPLAANGGTTFSHGLNNGSPAIDAGTNNGCPEVDQRDMQRPLDGNGDGTATCDIGAFEVGQPKIFLPYISNP